MHLNPGTWVGSKTPVPCFRLHNRASHPRAGLPAYFGPVLPQSLYEWTEIRSQTAQAFGPSQNRPRKPDPATGNTIKQPKVLVNIKSVTTTIDINCGSTHVGRAAGATQPIDQFSSKPSTSANPQREKHKTRGSHPTCSDGLAGRRRLFGPPRHQNENCGGVKGNVSTGWVALLVQQHVREASADKRVPET